MLNFFSFFFSSGAPAGQHYRSVRAWCQRNPIAFPSRKTLGYDLVDGLTNDIRFFYVGCNLRKRNRDGSDS